MRTIIISDLHLTPFFSKKKFKFLRRLISKCDQLIINGDFWDGYRTTFDKFVNSKWSGLFELMKSKNTIYIYGNHDRKEWMDNRTSLFSTKCVRAHTINLANGKKVLVSHGDITLSKYKKYLESSRIVLWLVSIPYSLLMWYESRLARIYGWNKEYWVFWEDKKAASDELLIHVRNLKRKKYDFFAFGHSHFPSISKKDGYINSGVIMHGLASYILIEGNDIKVVKKKYAIL